MNRADENEFAWALMGSAKPFLADTVNSWLCVKIGAGEQNVAIRELLERFVGNGATLPPALVASLWAWINGFVGSDEETALRDLAVRIRVAQTSHLSPPVHEDDPEVAQLIPRRSERAERKHMQFSAAVDERR